MCRNRVTARPSIWPHFSLRTPGDLDLDAASLLDILRGGQRVGRLGVAETSVDVAMMIGCNGFEVVSIWQLGFWQRRGACRP